MPTTRVLVAIVSLAVLCGCAGTNTAVKPQVSNQWAVQNSSCPRETGSRIPGSSAGCSAVGHAYSSDDIDRTGSMTAAGALRLLDPSITVH
jgi:hypothetical protein